MDRLTLIPANRKNGAIDGKEVKALLTRLWSSLSKEQQDAVLLIAAPEQFDEIAIRRLEERAPTLSHKSVERLARVLAAAIGKWETRSEICKRLGISLSKFDRRWALPYKPSCDAQFGITGRLSSVRSNLLLDAFLVGARHAVSEAASKIVRLAPLLSQKMPVTRLNKVRRRNKK